MAAKNLHITNPIGVIMNRNSTTGNSPEEKKLLQKLADLEEPLFKLDNQINWHSFIPLFEPIISLIEGNDRPVKKIHTKHVPPLLNRLIERDKRKRRRYTVMMIKLLVLQYLYNLSDEAMELEITDRLSFRRFLRIKTSTNIPRNKTIRIFREALNNQNLFEPLINLVRQQNAIQQLFPEKEKTDLAIRSEAPKNRKEILQFPDSELAHQLLDHLWGVEIGGSAHNSFHLPHCLNIDYCGDEDTIFKKAEIDLCGSAMKVDIVSEGDELPFKDDTLGFIITSHVIEHYFDPIKALKEWYRVIKPGGYIFTIAPHVDRVPEEHRGITPVNVLINRHLTGHRTPEDDEMAGGARGHHSVFNLDNFLELCEYLNYRVIATEDPDKKVGNGFTVVIQK